MSGLKTEDQHNGLITDNNVNNFQIERKIVKRKNWCKENSFLLIIIFLVILCLFGSIGIGLLRFTNIFKELLQSNENSDYEWLTKPSNNSYLNVHIFNYTNVDRFLTGLDNKLIVEDLGPFVYIETLSDAYSYKKANRTYEFSPELSTGKMYDKVWVPNVPMMSAMKLAKERNYFFRFGLDTIFTQLNSKPFKELTVDSFLWGYDDEFIDMMHKIDIRIFPNEKFGILKKRIKEQRSSDIIYGSHFPKYFVNNKKTIKVYVMDICMFFPLVYEKEVVALNDIPAFRFTTPDDVTHRVIDSVNKYDCHIDSEHCPSHGLFNITTCSNGAPIFASFPHFYMGDPKLSKKFIGLNPDPELHKTYIDIHTEIDIPLDGPSRFQINIEVQKCKPITKFDSFDDGDILPIIWIENLRNELKFENKPLIIDSAIFDSDNVQLVLEYGTLLLTIVTIIFIVIEINRRKKQNFSKIIPTTNCVEYQTNVASTTFE